MNRGQLEHRSPWSEVTMSIGHLANQFKCQYKNYQITLKHQLQRYVQSGYFLCGQSTGLNTCNLAVLNEPDSSKWCYSTNKLWYYRHISCSTDTRVSVYNGLITWRRRVHRTELAGVYYCRWCYPRCRYRYLMMMWWPL